MYLLDTDVISETSRGSKLNAGVRRFLEQAEQSASPLFISVVSVGELRRGVEILRRRKDLRRLRNLESWLETLLARHESHILDFGREEAHVWGWLRVPHPENELDKQIAATAITHHLTVVTHNRRHFADLHVEVIDPFE
jgi:predicted nucleic acid-binding protein